MYNIYIELELFLDPPITDEEELRKDLETKIKDWNNKRIEFKATIAKEYLNDQKSFDDPKKQAAEARKNKFCELQRQIQAAKEGGEGVVEGQSKKNILNKFKKYFSEPTICRELGIQTQETEANFPPKQPPASLQCKEPVPYNVMKPMMENLKKLGLICKKDLKNLYGLLNLPQTAELSKLSAAANKEKDRIHKILVKTVEVNLLNTLMIEFKYFETQESKKNYDVALKRYLFDQLCEEVLSFYVQGFTKQQKTNWKLYQEAITKTKRLGYSQAEADYLVYDYFVNVKKCPEPVPGEVQRGDGGIFGSSPSAKKMSDEELLGTFLDNAVKGVFG
jgi:hypothetical protein